MSVVDPLVLDSLPRMIGWLSLLGDREVRVDGKLVTDGEGRLPVEITNSFFRQFTCVDGCFVCCAVLSVTLDYLAEESAWTKMPDEKQELFDHPRVVDVNGQKVLFMSKSKRRGPPHQPRETDGSPYCTFLKPIRPGGGLGCDLWQSGSPLGCATSYNMRVTEQVRHERRTVRITKQGMSRSWRYHPAPECEFLTVDKPDIEENIKLFIRLQEWAEILHLLPAFERIETIIDRLIKVHHEGRVPNQTLVFP